MAEERSRPVLGDITNQIRKRGVPDGVKTGGKILHCNENNLVGMGKRYCLSPRLCADVNSSQGNENEESNVLDLSSVFEASESVCCDFKDGRCLGGSKVCDVNEKREECVGFQKERGVKSITTQDDLSKDTVFVESTSRFIDLTVGEDIVNHGMHKSDNMLCSSRIFSKQKHSTSNDMGVDDLRKVSEKDDDCVLLGENPSLGDNLCEIKVSQEDGNDVNMFPPSQSGSIDCTSLPDLSRGTDSFGHCCCSFCTKAKYIWLDLHYQDIKGRVTAIRKSQKEANMLAESSSRAKAISVAGNSNRASQLESQLTYQWRAMFQHMSNLFEQESNQLEASLLPLSDLKEKCKTEMASSNDV